MKIGLTLPSFVEDPEIPIAVAREAERAGIDGVFVFDHLFRRAADGARRPALEGLTLLGAVAAETERINVGTLVARASLRPAATLAAGLETAQRISRGRVIATIGAGDEESRDENESFGLDFATMTERVDWLRAAVDSARGRGFPVWIGGTAAAVRRLAAERADGWNRWGGPAARFAEQAEEMRRAVGNRRFTVSWGGLVVLGADERTAEAKAKRLQAGPHVLVGSPSRVAGELGGYRDAGAEWIILGPIDSTDVENAALVAAVGALLGSSRDSAE